MNCSIQKIKCHYLKDIKPKLASTLVLLFPDENNLLHFVLIKRPQYNGVHSNQYALPGGKKKETKTRKKPHLEKHKKGVESKEMKYELLGNCQRYMFLRVIS